MKPEEKAVIVSDHLWSSDDLSRDEDHDFSTNQSLAIKWNLELAGILSYEIKDVHIYVQIDDDPQYHYLGRTGGGLTWFFEWKKNAPLTARDFRIGPLFGHRYSFAVYALTNSGSPLFYGPLSNDGSINYKSSIVVTDDLNCYDDLCGRWDEDREGERILVVRWPLDPEAIDLSDLKDFHIYVKARDASQYAYVGRTADPTADSFEWRAGTPHLAPDFMNGPVFGESYEFRLYALTYSMNPLFYGPFACGGRVEYIQTASP